MHPLASQICSHLSRELQVVALCTAVHPPLPISSAWWSMWENYGFKPMLASAVGEFCSASKIQLSLTSKAETFSDLSLLVTCGQKSFILYSPERLLLFVALLTASVSFLVNA